MSFRTLLFAGLLTAAAAPALAQDYYGSGYDERAGYGYDEQRQVRSVADFEAPLAQYGRWVSSSFGRAWAPRVARDWRPYTVGRWVETEDGETWESDEPWGWATYHYGRWGFDTRYGWVWTPDTEWAPAWVAWRDGDDYAGWAPLPPQGVYGSGYQDWDFDRWYAPSWIYVQRSNLYRRDLGRTVLPWRSNRNLWDRTRESQRGWDGSQRRDGGQAYWNRGRNGDGRPDRMHSGDGRPAAGQGGTQSGYGTGAVPDWRNAGRPGWPGRNASQWQADGRPGYPPVTATTGSRPDRASGGNGWNGGARPWRNDPRGGQAGAMQQRPAGGYGQRPGMAQGQRPGGDGAGVPGPGREGMLSGGGRERPAVQPQPQPVAQPRPQVQPPAQAEQPRAERPHGDGPRRERDNRQPQ